MKTLVTKTEATTSNIDKLFGSVILPNTQKGRNRLFASNHASLRRTQNAIKRKEEQEAKPVKAAERAAAKEAKAKETADAKEVKAAERIASKEAAKAQKRSEEVKLSAYTRQVLIEGDQIADQEATFHKRFVLKANAELYKLLQIIMAYAEKILARKDSKNIVASMRHSLKYSHRINTQANTPELSIIVRFVTRTNRKNACVYARVIKKAIADGVKSSDLIAYIEKHKGIDKIRSKAVANASSQPKVLSEQDIKDTKFLVDFGTTFLSKLVESGTTLGTLELQKKYYSTIRDASSFSNYTYFACDYVDGKYVVVDVVPVDPDFEPVILERISNYHLQCNTHHKEIANAMIEAAAENGRTLKKELHISASE